MYRKSLINENKWRAARFGLDGKLIDLGKRIEVPTESLLLELLEFVDDVVEELGITDDIRYVYEILNRRTGADRQLAVFRETGDLCAVARYIIEETEVGIPVA
jgi:carboxylate-amine ligase